VYKNISHYLIANRAQLIKFIIFGFLIFWINFFCFYVLYSIAGFNYKISISIAYIIAVISHFFLHRTFTFNAVEQDIVHHVWKHALMLCSNYFLTFFIVWFSVNELKVSPYLGLVISTAISAGVSFLVMKYFVFD
jgi:putative flippase GtrA